ncbi:hypothetical protein [Chroococcidiopsis cubana]|nr:hypothetical protein [Chroococcidiopsis cubana]
MLSDFLTNSLAAMVVLRLWSMIEEHTARIALPSTKRRYTLTL